MVTEIKLPRSCHQAEIRDKIQQATYIATLQSSAPREKEKRQCVSKTYSYKRYIVLKPRFET